MSVYRTIGPLVLVFAQNIDVEYSLEPSKNKKDPCKSQFYYNKSGI